jgi:hypothetical protein
MRKVATYLKIGSAEIEKKRSLQKASNLKRIEEQGWTVFRDIAEDESLTSCSY